LLEEVVVLNSSQSCFHSLFKVYNSDSFALLVNHIGPVHVREVLGQLVHGIKLQTLVARSGSDFNIRRSARFASISSSTGTGLLRFISSFSFNDD